MQLTVLIHHQWDCNTEGRGVGGGVSVILHTVLKSQFQPQPQSAVHVKLKSSLHWHINPGLSLWGPAKAPPPNQLAGTRRFCWPVIVKCFLRISRFSNIKYKILYGFYFVSTGVWGTFYFVKTYQVSLLNLQRHNTAQVLIWPKFNPNSKPVLEPVCLILQ